MTSITYDPTARAPFLYLVTSPSLTAHADSYASADKLLSYTIDSGQGLAPAVTAGTPGLDWDDKPSDAPGGDDDSTGPYSDDIMAVDLVALEYVVSLMAQSVRSRGGVTWEAQP